MTSPKMASWGFLLKSAFKSLFATHFGSFLLSHETTRDWKGISEEYVQQTKDGFCRCDEEKLVRKVKSVVAFQTPLEWNFL